MRTFILVLAICLAVGIQMASAQQIAAQMASAARQRDAAIASMTLSIQRQTGSLASRKSTLLAMPATAREALPPPPAEFFVTETVLPPTPVDQATIDCAALPDIKVESLVDEASRETDVSPNLLKAVMRQESAFHPCAVSHSGAMGLMQLMPQTADYLGVDDAMDPRQNVLGGARLLHSLLERYSGNLGMTLGAYNAGPSRVDAAGGVPDIPETTSYVERILTNLGLSPDQH